MSLNPPENEYVPDKVFEDALERIEKKLDLTGQPRAFVFHEKNGRRHAHAVWSRIDVERMRAVNMQHFKRGLTETSKRFYSENEWPTPKYLIEPKLHVRLSKNCGLPQKRQIRR